MTNNTKSVNSASVEILATAGNNNEIHIWKTNVSALHDKNSNADSEGPSAAKKAKIFSIGSPNINHLTTLTRHERSINAISFSPHGTHLASAGDGGTLMVHTVPAAYRPQPQQIQTNSTSGQNNRINRNLTHNPTVFWKSVLQSEKDLSMKMVHTGSEDIMDISWSVSPDENRFMVGTLDHSVLVFEEQLKLANSGMENYTNRWNCVWKNTKEHTHYVQGVAYDPLGVYMASQGSDRTVRVWQRKPPSKKSSSSSETKTQGSELNQRSGGSPEQRILSAISNNSQFGSIAPRCNSNSVSDPTALNIERHLRGKFNVGKAKVLKYRTNAGIHTPTTDKSKSQTGDNNESIPPTKKRHLFADESTVESFFRRLSWTTDGAFLVIPASLWHADSAHSQPEKTQSEATVPPSFATYLFARHQFDRPSKVLFGLEKPSLVIRPNPVLFQLPNQAQDDSKENMAEANSAPSTLPQQSQANAKQLPYRSIFAVLTVDTIVIYDTYHTMPLCIARGLHYSGLTDCAWTSDGRHLVVCSTDGYISFLSFDKGELGCVYRDATQMTYASTLTTVPPCKTIPQSKDVKMTMLSNGTTLTPPPCEDGQSVILVAPPTKKARITMGESGSNVNTMQVRKKKKPQKKRVTPTLVTGTTQMEDTENKAQDDVTNQDENLPNIGNEKQKAKSLDSTSEKEVVGGVTNLSLDNSFSMNL